MQLKEIGIIGLFLSRKATFCLIVFIVSSIGLFSGKLQGMNYAAIVASITTIWTAAHAFQQRGMNNDLLPPK